MRPRLGFLLHCMLLVAFGFECTFALWSSTAMVAEMAGEISATEDAVPHVGSGDSCDEPLDGDHPMAAGGHGDCDCGSMKACVCASYFPYMASLLTVQTVRAQVPGAPPGQEQPLPQRATRASNVFRPPIA